MMSPKTMANVEAVTQIDTPGMSGAGHMDTASHPVQN